MDPLMIAAGGLKAQQAELHAWSADVTNAQTPGFLALLPTTVGYPAGALARVGAGKEAPISPPMAQDVAAETATTIVPSAVRPTGVVTDFALTGSAFFQVRTPTGVAYTRDGRFHVAANGWLVNAQGSPVLTTGGKSLVVGTHSFSVQSDGTVIQSGKPIGRLALSGLATRGLVALGNSLYRGTAQAATGVVVQGALNTSNVSLATALTGLIATQTALQSTGAVAHGEQQRIATIDQLGVVS